MDANKIETMKGPEIKPWVERAKELGAGYGNYPFYMQAEINELRAEVERLRAELAAGAAREGGNTSECVGCEGSPIGSNNPCAACGGSAPAAGTVEKDASQRVGKRIHNIWEDAQIAWGDACGGPPAYEIFAYSLISAMQEESAAMAHTKGKDAA